MHKNTINILLLEDSSSDATLIQQMMKGHESFDANVDWVKSISAAQEWIGSNVFDLIITDLGLPDSNGIETIARLKCATDQIPIIALTGEAPSLGLDAIRAGANDFIPKDQISKPIIARAITYTIERFQMTKALHEANRLLEQKNDRLAQMYKMSQQFVDNVSHEFRTPLTVIKEFASIIRDGIDGPVTPKQQERLATLITRTNDLALMVEDLLDTSRLESGLLKTCRKEQNLRQIIFQVEKMLQPRAIAKKIKLTMTEVSRDLQIFCDEEKLRRILVNLVVNAIKFTPAQGQIQISAAVADANRIKVTVSDNGHGISPEDLNHIFKRFQQAGDQARMSSCKGFGLGLSIARSLASLNLGSLEVSSTEGKGSQFSILIPIARVDAILNCYFDQREASPIGDGQISIVEVRPDNFSEEDTEEVIETIDDFLQSSTKNFDLIFQPNDDQWLMINCVSASQLPDLIARLKRDWREVNRNHFGVALPQLNFRCLETMDIANGRDKLTKSIRQLNSTPKATPAKKTKIVSDCKRLLVVDDEVELASALETRLIANGFDVTTALDGEAGVKISQAMMPDAILMDIRMPKLSGLDALTQIKFNPQTSTIPVIILSASLHDQRQALDRGAHYFIHKPFDSNSILAALATVFQQNETRQTNAIVNDRSVTELSEKETSGKDTSLLRPPVSRTMNGHREFQLRRN